ncbi:hypothetical protein BESB_037710 [Besnoitia besnoiti]|uniref:Zinc finger PHD-type domain-containing protein n=1 Tax=Besnoitia besnoiti TaxID=94643 RepID=A0A2A9MN77_BESBE|nr:hypothetical protein BESB_037710 [Besnoitia besnoiti]PFH37313.1 hypothetical protein BESB_037710 [Besnoitia besnoiti]
MAKAVSLRGDESSGLRGEPVPGQTQASLLSETTERDNVSVSSAEQRQDSDNLEAGSSAQPGNAQGTPSASSSSPSPRSAADAAPAEGQHAIAKAASSSAGAASDCSVSVPDCSTEGRAADALGPPAHPSASVSSSFVAHASAVDPKLGAGRKQGMSRELLKLLSGSGNSFDELCISFNNTGKHGASRHGSSGSAGSLPRSASTNHASCGDQRGTAGASGPTPSPSSSAAASSSPLPASASPADHTPPSSSASSSSNKHAAPSTSSSRSATAAGASRAARAEGGKAKGESAASTPRAGETGIPAARVCEDEETAKAIAAALAAEMETCRELSSLLNNGKKGSEDSAVPIEILMALSGQRSRRPTRSSLAASPPTPQQISKGANKTKPIAVSGVGRTNPSLSAASSPAPRASRPSPSSASASTGDARIEVSSQKGKLSKNSRRSQGAVSEDRRQADAKPGERAADKEINASKNVLEDADEATQAAIAALLAEEIGGSKEAKKLLLEGGGSAEAYELLAVSMAARNGRRRARRLLATTASSETSATHPPSDDATSERRSKAGGPVKKAERAHAAAEGADPLSGDRVRASGEASGKSRGRPHPKEVAAEDPQEADKKTTKTGGKSGKRLSRGASAAHEAQGQLVEEEGTPRQKADRADRQGASRGGMGAAAPDAEGVGRRCPVREAEGGTEEERGAGGQKGEVVGSRRSQESKPKSLGRKREMREEADAEMGENSSEDEVLARQHERKAEKTQSRVRAEKDDGRKRKIAQDENAEESPKRSARDNPATPKHEGKAGTPSLEAKRRKVKEEADPRAEGDKAGKLGQDVEEESAREESSAGAKSEILTDAGGVAAASPRETKNSAAKETRGSPSGKAHDRGEEGARVRPPAKRPRTLKKSSEEEVSTTSDDENARVQSVESADATSSLDRACAEEVSASEAALFSHDAEETAETGEESAAAARCAGSALDGPSEATTRDALENDPDEVGGEAGRTGEQAFVNNRAERDSSDGKAHQGLDADGKRGGRLRGRKNQSDAQESDDENETGIRTQTECIETGWPCSARDRSQEDESQAGGTEDGTNARAARATAAETRPLKIRKRVIKMNAAVNFTLCGICGGFGDVLCCDFCPRVFHPACLFKYRPLQVFVPVELRSAAASALSAAGAPPHGSHLAIPDWTSLPPPPPPLPEYRSHARAGEGDERPRRRARGEQNGTLTQSARRESEEESGEVLWMCPDCYGVPYSASRPSEHPAWKLKCLDWRRIAEEESSLFLSFPSLDAIQPYFGDEDAWRSFRERKGQKLLKRSATIAKTVLAASGKGATADKKKLIPANTIFVRLGDFPLSPARHLLHAMGKKTALQAVAFLKNLLLRVANSSKEEEQMNFLEFGAEVAYLLTNLLGYLGASRHLVDPIVDAASCILLLWSKRRRKLGKDAIMTDEALIFSTLEACWAQLVLHRYSTTSGLRASPASASLTGGEGAPKTTLSCSLGEQKLYYRGWKEEVERSIAASRLEFLYFDFRHGQLLYYDLSTCPNCDRSGGVSGRYAVCSLCNFHLPPEWACVDFGRLFEQLVWGSLMQRAGITPCGAKKGRSCWGDTSPVEQILLEMKTSLRPWRNRLDLGTEDWKNQVYMVTHALFVVSGWGRYRLDLRERFWLPDTRFLRLALHEAMLIGDVELTGEILHSLHLFVVSEAPRRALLNGSGESAASGQAPPRLLSEADEEELQAEQFAIDLAIQHGIIYLLYKQSKTRGCWTAKHDSFYKTFHTSFCAAIGLIRPHRASSSKSSASSPSAAGTSPSQSVDRTHSEWQRLFCSSWPHASVSLATPDAVDRLEASRAAMLSPAVSKARRAASDAPPVVPLSCGAPHFLRPRSADERAVRVATVKVCVRRPLRRMTSSLWRRLCASALATTRHHKKSVKLFGEKSLLAPNAFGKTEEISVGIYCFQGLCFVSLEDLAALLLCEPLFLEHRVLAFVRPALVLPTVDAQHAQPNRHVPPAFHRYFTAFENRNLLNGGEAASAPGSPSWQAPASAPSAASASDAARGEDREGAEKRRAHGGGESDARGGTVRPGASSRKLFSLLDLKELLTLQSIMGIAEALVLQIEENIGALLRAVETSSGAPSPRRPAGSEAF